MVELYHVTVQHGVPPVGYYRPGKVGDNKGLPRYLEAEKYILGPFMSVVSNDHPLIMVCLNREKKDEDFSARDMYLMNTLKDPLERKFYQLLEEEQRIGPNSPPGKLSRTAASYGLTKRETEIVYLVCGGKSSEDICSQLYITPATLSKHLSNIYAKTKVRNRTQLFGLFHEL